MAAAMNVLDEGRPRGSAPNGIAQADIRLGGLSYVAGPVEPLETWCAREGLEADVVRQLSQAGLRSIAQSPVDGGSALTECMSAAVAGAGLRPEDISAICFAPPSFDWSRGAEADLFRAIAASEFRRLPVVGIGLQGCGAIGATVEVASALALGRNRPVLIVLSALPQEGARFDDRSMRLFSCGVACAVLAEGAGAYRVLGTTATSDLGLALTSLRDDPTVAFQDSWQLLRTALADLIDSADSSPTDITFVCGSNVNQQAVMVIAMAAGISRERVWAGGLAELGHLYSADALVALAHLERSGRLQPGDKILVVGWSEWVIGGILLEYLP